MHSIPKKAALFALLAFVFNPGLLHAAPVWPLLNEVRVSGNSIYLSDLLPPQTSSEFRSFAARIRLGSAPAPGASMTIKAEKIEELIPRSTRMELRLPSEIVVRRDARLVSREEVLAAVNAALSSNSFPGNPRIDPDDLHFGAQVRVASDEAHLRVRQVEFDPGLQQARFLMVSSDAPRSLPFWVTGRLRSEPPAAGATSLTQVSLSSRLSHTSPSDTSLGSDVLIASGKPAHLHVVSGSMQMFLDVIALEPGGLHQTIRVRVPASNRVLRGEIVAPGRLEARF